MNAKLKAHPDAWLLGMKSLREGSIGKAASSAAAQVGGRPAVASATAPPASRSYLETKRNTITINPRIEIRSCGCKCWFCPRCCMSLGLNLRRKLLPIVEQWKHPMMLTFTIDPELFKSPDEAFRYVTDQSCLGRTMQHLRRAGVLNGAHWFAVIEWQSNGWPHWHVLVDADRIDFDVLKAAWNQNWSKSAERIAIGRPGFGSVRFTRPQFKNAQHAARYATKYLIKHPEHGYPSWVVEQSSRRIRRFTTSRPGFWGTAGGVEASDEAMESMQDADDEESNDVDDPSTRRRRTVAEVVASCGSSSVVLQIADEIDTETGEQLPPRCRFLARIPASVTEVGQRLGVDPERNRITLFDENDWQRAMDDLRITVDSTSMVKMTGSYRANAEIQRVRVQRTSVQPGKADRQANPRHHRGCDRQLSGRCDGLGNSDRITADRTVVGMEGSSSSALKRDVSQI